jgi:two-component SAPR family response regulator
MNQKIGLYSLLFLFHFLIAGTAYSQQTPSNRASFADQVFIVSNYSDLNNNLEKETNSMAYLLKAGVRGFNLHLTLNKENNQVQAITPQSDTVSFQQLTTPIRRFLEQSPRELVILFIEHSFPDHHVELALDSAKLSGKLFREEGALKWPGVKDITADGKQLICFFHKKTSSQNPGFFYLWDYAVEPHFSLSSEPDFHGDYLKGNSSNPYLLFTGFNLPKDTTGLFIPFRNFDVNENPYLISYTLNLWKKTGKRPNFLFLNRYRTGIVGVYHSLLNHQTISGIISYNRSPLERVKWEGDQRSITSGTYSFPFIEGEDIYIKPSKPGFRFIPEDVTISNATANIEQNFMAIPLDIDHEIVAYYPLRKDFRDYSLNSYHGRSFEVEVVDDKQRGPVALLNDSAYIILPEADKMGLRNQDFTVSAWIKINSFSDRRDFTILGTEQNNYRKGLHLQLRDRRAYFGFWANDLNGNTHLRENQWYHITWRYTKYSGEQAIFINGLNDGSSLNHPPFMGNEPLIIGKAIKMNNFFNGKISDLTIWKRPLGDEEIWQLYQQLVSIKTPSLAQRVLHDFSAWILATLGILVLVILYFFFQQKKSPKAYKVISIDSQANTAPKENCILLFGEFYIRNRDGIDISAAFTPKVKQLFTLLLLHTTKTTKGISSDDINHLIWPGLTRKNASNNRSVTLNKLRLLLQELDGVAISNHQEYWSLEIASPLFCDYMECYKAVHSNQLSSNNDTFTHFYNLVRRGSLLSDMEYDWLDDYKAFIASEIIDNLIRYIEHLDKNIHPQLTIEICDRIFQGDPLNEEALAFKIKALKELKLKNKARYAYQKFTSDYETCLGQKYPVSFDQLYK